MSAALDRITDQPPTAVATRDAHTRLGEWAQQAREATGMADSISRTPFVPASLKDRDPAVTRGNVIGALLTGLELGLEPMAALRSIDIVQGTPAMRAVALRALVQSRGHEVWVEEQTDTRAVVAGRRAGSEQVQKSEWTIERAARMKLTGKDNWTKQPSAMLVARATSEICRLIAADVILGVPYSAEELRDETTSTPQRERLSVADVVAPQVPATAPTAAPEPAAPLPCDDDAAEMTEAEWAEGADQP